MATAPNRPSIFPRGQASVEVLAPKIFASRLTGHLDVRMMRHLLDHLEAWRRDAGNELVTFHDLEEVADYDSEARVLITPWSRQHRGQFRAVHVLVRSPTVAWGLRILTTLTDQVIVPHHERTAFEGAKVNALFPPSAPRGRTARAG